MNNNLFKVSVIALFASIICIGCFMRIPIGPVPIVLQNALCILTACILGNFLAVLPVLIFMTAGLIGLPVFSGGTGGITVFAGPTGGFLAGYVLGALVCGLISGKPSIFEKKHQKAKILKISMAVIIGMLIIYIPGIIHFTNWAIKTNKVPSNISSFSFTFKTCVLPYIPGDIIKMIIIIPVAVKIRPLIAHYLYSTEKKNYD